jgi:hypothetical protein
MKTKIRVFELDPVKGRPPGTLSISATKIKGRGWNPTSVSAYMYGLEFDPAIRNVDPIGYRRLTYREAVAKLATGLFIPLGQARDYIRETIGS